MPETVKVHVTFDETKRVLSHQKGADVEGLRLVFVQVFSDVLSSDIAPAQVKFQLYDDYFKDHVELSNDKRLEEDIKVRAFVSKQADQVFLVTLAVIFNIFKECPRGVSVYSICFGEATSVLLRLACMKRISNFVAFCIFSHLFLIRWT